MKSIKNISKATSLILVLICIVFGVVKFVSAKEMKVEYDMENFTGIKGENEVDKSNPDIMKINSLLENAKTSYLRSSDEVTPTVIPSDSK